MRNRPFPFRGVPGSLVGVKSTGPRRDEMRKVIVSEFMTLDGVIEDPGGAEGSPIGGWSFKFADASGERERLKFDELMECDAQLLGRVTYEAFANAWPSIQDEAGYAAKMNSMPKYVVTSTLDELGWENSRRIGGDVAGAVRRLKAEPGGAILVGGSGTLVRTLAREGLVDEYRLMIHPIV